jgi:hypothetical protein
MSEDLKRMFNNELFSDVTFKVENEMIYAHKVINNNNNKSQNQSLTMRNCDQSFDSFLHFRTTKITNSTLMLLLVMQIKSLFKSRSFQ